MKRRNSADYVQILDLVLERDDQLGLGYTIVCNRSQNDLGISIHARHAREAAFLESPPWNEAPKRRTGINALRSRLNDLLVDLTRRSFDAVSEEIEDRLTQANRKLGRLGQSRSASDQQRIYLLQIASSFQSLAAKAVDAYYGRDECFQKYASLRLATTVMGANEDFAKDMQRHGAGRDFADDPVSEAGHDAEDIVHTPDADDIETSNFTARSSPKPEDLIFSQFPDLQIVLGKKEKPPAKDTESVMEWIGHLYRRSRGFEIGTINPSLLPSLFFEQTRSWHFYSIQHVRNIVFHVHGFIRELLGFLCEEHGVANRIWAKLGMELRNTYTKALEHATFLVEVERTGNLITLNHYFADIVQKRRLARVEKRLKDLRTWTTNDDQKDTLLRLEDTLSALASNDDHTIEDLHDSLKSYHKVARKRFVDAICKQVIDYHVICSKNGPLWVFSPHLIGKLSEQELEHIAGDDPEIVTRRKDLVAEIEGLKNGRLALLG